MTAQGTSARPGPSGSTGAVAARKGKLCPSLLQGGAKPKAMKMNTVQAEGETPLGDELPIGDGKWTWINLWAGFCDPCMEEIPRLKQWEAKLSSKLRVAFVSVDEDARLSERFLAKQPASGARKSWLMDDSTKRAEWLDSMGASMKTLPVHIFVDPQGSVRCIVNGEVLPSDLPEIEAMVGAGK